MIFLRSPGFTTPTELAGWLLDQDVAPADWLMYRGPDGLWRGSGLRHGGHPVRPAQADAVAVQPGVVAQDDDGEGGR
jgi:hypothetical protein